MQRLEASLRGSGVAVPNGGSLRAVDHSDVPSKLRAGLRFSQGLAGLFRRRIIVLDGLTADDPGGVVNPKMPDTIFVNLNRERPWRQRDILKNALGILGQESLNTFH